MRQREIWRLLGVAPTRDVGAIRKAYAGALKGLDPDRDPEGFQALRQAREFALMLAAEPEGDPVEADLAFDPELAVADEEPQPEDPLAPHYQRFIAILYPGEEAQDQPLDDATADLLVEDFRALLTDPRLEQIDSLGAASDWFANTIAGAVPRSDVLIEPAARFFGWHAEHEINQPPAVAFLMERARTFDFLREVTVPGHPLHKAWVELTTPAYERSRRGRVPRKQVMELLNVVRNRYPAAESNFDYDRVDLWERSHSGWTIAGGTWTLIWAGVLLLSHCARMMSDSPEPSPPVVIQQPGAPAPAVSGLTLADQDTAITAALRPLVGDSLDAPRLASANPQLYALLASNWRIARDAGEGQAQFRFKVETAVREQARRAQPKASLALLRRDAAMDLEEARIARGIGDRRCASYFRGAALGGSDLPGDLRTRRQDWLGDLLKEADALDSSALPHEEYTFSIPAKVVDDAARRTGLTPDQLGEGWMKRGDEARLCRANIALLEAVLDLPDKEAARMLKAMNGAEPQG